MNAKIARKFLIKLQSKNRENSVRISADLIGEKKIQTKLTNQPFIICFAKNAIEDSKATATRNENFVRMNAI
jgi:hypothetical protein